MNPGELVSQIPHLRIELRLTPLQVRRDPLPYIDPAFGEQVQQASRPCALAGLEGPGIETLAGPLLVQPHENLDIELEKRPPRSQKRGAQIVAFDPAAHPFDQAERLLDLAEGFLQIAVAAV